MLSSVDFPAPDLPMTPTNSPLPTCMLIPLRAVNSPAAVEYTFTTSTSSTRADPFEEPGRDKREADTSTCISFPFRTSYNKIIRHRPIVDTVYYQEMPI